jgi:hypothetical protein
VVSVARKLSTTEERGPIPKLFVSRGGYRSKGDNIDKLLGSSFNEDNFCSSENKHDSKAAPRTKLHVLERKLQEQRPQIPVAPTNEKQQMLFTKKFGVEFSK